MRLSLCRPNPEASAYCAGDGPTRVFPSLSAAEKRPARPRLSAGHDRRSPWDCRPMEGSALYAPGPGGFHRRDGSSAVRLADRRSVRAPIRARADSRAGIRTEAHFKLADRAVRFCGRPSRRTASAASRDASVALSGEAPSGMSPSGMMMPSEKVPSGRMPSRRMPAWKGPCRALAARGGGPTPRRSPRQSPPRRAPPPFEGEIAPCRSDASPPPPTWIGSPPRGSPQPRPCRAPDPFEGAIAPSPSGASPPPARPRASPRPSRARSTQRRAPPPSAGEKFHSGWARAFARPPTRTRPKPPRAREGDRPTLLDAPSFERRERTFRVVDARGGLPRGHSATIDNFVPKWIGTGEKGSPRSVLRVRTWELISTRHQSSYFDREQFLHCLPLEIRLVRPEPQMRAAASETAHVSDGAGHYRHRAATSRSVRVRDGVLPAGPRRGRVGGGEPRPPAPSRAGRGPRRARGGGARHAPRARRGCPPRGPRRHPEARGQGDGVRRPRVRHVRHAPRRVRALPRARTQVRRGGARRGARRRRTRVVRPIPADPSALARPAPSSPRRPVLLHQRGQPPPVLRKMPHRLRASRRRHRRPQQSRARRGCSRDARRPGQTRRRHRRRHSARRRARGRRIPRGGAMGPTNQRPSAAKRTSGVSNPRTRRGAIPRGIRRHARGGGGAGIGPGWASAGAEDLPSPARRARASRARRPGTVPLAEHRGRRGGGFGDDDDATFDRDGEGDRVGAERRARGRGLDGSWIGKRRGLRRVGRRGDGRAKMCPGVSRETRTLPSRGREGWWFARRVWTIPGRGPRPPAPPSVRGATRQASPGRRPRRRRRRRSG